MCLAIPGKIATIVVDQNFGLRSGKVDFGGIRKEICLNYLPEAQIGDYVLVHVGFALTVINEQEAQRVFEVLRDLDQLQELQEDPPATKDGS